MVVGYAEIYIFPKFGRRKESKGKKKNFNRRAEASVQRGEPTSVDFIISSAVLVLELSACRSLRSTQQLETCLPCTSTNSTIYGLK